MKFVFLSFYLFFLLNSSISIPFNPQNYVYFQIKDSSTSENNTNTQFFESKSPNKLLKFPFDKISGKSRKFTFSSYKNYLANPTLLKACPSKDSQILSIKSY